MASGAADYTKPVLASVISDLLRVAGVALAGGVLDVRTVAGPATYAAGGVPVDVSAAFPVISAVWINRVYTTATKAATVVYIPAISETGTDTFANGKFRIVGSRIPSHTHTYDRHDPNTSTLGAGSTYTSTASGTPSASNMVEQSAGGTGWSAATLEFTIKAVPA